MTDTFGLSLAFASALVFLVWLWYESNYGGWWR